jgi:hypothetical protein
MTIIDGNSRLGPEHLVREASEWLSQTFLLGRDEDLTYDLFVNEPVLREMHHQYLAWCRKRQREREKTKGDVVFEMLKPLRYTLPMILSPFLERRGSSEDRISILASMHSLTIQLTRAGSFSVSVNGRDECRFAVHVLPMGRDKDREIVCYKIGMGLILPRIAAVGLELPVVAVNHNEADSSVNLSFQVEYPSSVPDFTRGHWMVGQIPYATAVQLTIDLDSRVIRRNQILDADDRTVLDLNLQTP